jgi:hypothetical protein
MIKSFVIAPVTGLFVGGLMYYFAGVFIGVLAGLAAGAALLYMTFFSENIYFELDEDGSFRYFKKGTLRNSFAIQRCNVGYYRKSERGLLGSHDIRLKILDPEAGEDEIEIDCSPLGVSGFHEMFERLDELSANERKVLSAK